jgi:hypothetical protein
MNPNLIIVIGGVTGYFIACFLFGERLPVLSIQAFLGTALGVVASIGLMFAASIMQKHTTTRPQTQQPIIEDNQQGREETNEDQARLSQARLFRQLLLRIAGGDNGAASEMYQTVQNDRQGVALCAHLHSLSDDDRKKVLSTFSDAPNGFQKVILKSAKKTSNKSIIGMIIEIILLPFIGLLGLHAITSQSIVSGLTAIFGMFIGVVGLVISFRILRVANEVIVYLKKN